MTERSLVAFFSSSFIGSFVAAAIGFQLMMNRTTSASSLLNQYESENFGDTNVPLKMQAPLGIFLKYICVSLLLASIGGVAMYFDYHPIA